MNNRTRRIILILTAIWMLAFGILNCVYSVYGAAEEELKEVSVAYFYDKTYFGENYDSDDKKGFGYEYLQIIGNFSGWKYDYIYGDYNSLLEQFMLGRIDLMPAVPRSFDSEAYYKRLKENAKNDEMRKYIDNNSIEVLFPNQPMNSVDYYVCVPGDTDIENFNIVQLLHQNVAYPTIISDYVADWLKKLGITCNLIGYESEAACINALNAGKVDAIVAQNNAAEAGLAVTRKAGNIDYYLAVSSNERSLLRDINNSMEAISSSTGDLMASIQNSYNSTESFETTLSNVEKKWLKENSKIIFGTLNDFKPYSYYDEKTGECEGFIYDSVSGVIDNQDIDLEAEFKHYETYDQLLEALLNEEVDAAFPVPSFLNQSEYYGYAYTMDVSDDDMILVCNGEYSEEVFQTIAYPAGGIEQYYDMMYFSDSALYDYDNALDCIKAVYKDKVPCTILREQAVEDIIEENSKYKKLNRIHLPNRLTLSIGIKRGNVGLFTFLNRTTFVASKGTYLSNLLLNSRAGNENSKKSPLASFLASEGFIYTLIILLLIVIIILLSTSMVRVLRASQKLKRANTEIQGVAKLQQQNFDVIGILARDYSSVFKINLDTEDIQAFRLENGVEGSFANLIRVGSKFSDVFNQYVRDSVFEDDKQKMYDEIGINVIRKKLKRRNSYAVRFRKVVQGEEPRYYEMRVSSIDVDITGKILSIVLAFIDCNDEILHEMKYMKSLEKALKSDAVITGLTGDFDWVAYVVNTETKDGSTGVTHYRIGDMFTDRFENWENESNYSHMMYLIAQTLIVPEDRKQFLNETNKNYIRRHLSNDMAFFTNFRIINKEDEVEFYQMKCVSDIVDGRLYGFIIGFHSVDEEIRKERAEQERLEQKVAERTAQLKEKNESLNRMNNDIIELMGNVVEGRDEESGQHVRRVKNFTNIMANQVMNDYPEFELTEELVDIITSASALHDVGKIMIPDSILLKPGRLTDEEFEIMKTHTISGCQILEKMPTDWDQTYMRISMEICRSHHEKYDGRGYPDGLSGDMIPISAQIVAVADCYDALVSKRVYKDAYTCDEAYNMIRNGECGVFSPKVMDSFSRCKDQFEQQVNSTK